MSFGDDPPPTFVSVMKYGWLYLLMLCPLLVDAGGFQINTQSQKAASMGGSVTGLALDASVVFFNPGAMSMLDSNAFNAGFTAMLPRTAFLGVTGAEEKLSSSVFIPAYAYGAFHLKNKWHVGLGINRQFGFSRNWEESWSGRYLAQESRLFTLFVQPSISYKLSEKLSIGAGPSIVLGNAELIRAVPVSNQNGTDGQVTIDGSGNGIGFNAGLFFESGRTSVGLSYRSAVTLSVEEGEATFSNIPSSLISNGTYPFTATFNSEVTLPSVVSLGIGQRIGEKIMANIDVNYTGWEVYDSLVYEFPDQSALNTTAVRNYKNSLAVRLGAQYQYTERLKLRAGLAFDQSPVQNGYMSPELPDADRIIVSGGFTWLWKKGWSIEATLLFEDLKERREDNNVENNFNGTYKSFIYAAGVGIQYMF